MSTLVISDTHLTPKFDETFFARLSALIDAHDSVVINGDFWDGYVTSFEAFLRSPWQRLFGPLRNRHAIYLHGNHDPAEMCNAGVDRFSVQQTAQYILHAGTQKFVIEHGHRLTKSIFVRASEWLPTALSRWMYRQYAAFAARPTALRGWLLEQEKRRDLAGELAIRQFLRSNPNASDTWLIAGHTHLPCLARGLRYANSGRCGGNHPTYLVVRDNGDIELGELA